MKFIASFCCAISLVFPLNWPASIIQPLVYWHKTWACSPFLDSHNSIWISNFNLFNRGTHQSLMLILHRFFYLVLWCHVARTWLHILLKSLAHHKPSSRSLAQSHPQPYQVGLYTWLILFWSNVRCHIDRTQAVVSGIAHWKRTCSNQVWVTKGQFHCLKTKLVKVIRGWGICKTQTYSCQYLRSQHLPS